MGNLVKYKNEEGTSKDSDNIEVEVELQGQDEVHEKLKLEKKLNMKILKSSKNLRTEQACKIIG